MFFSSSRSDRFDNVEVGAPSTSNVRQAGARDASVPNHMNHYLWRWEKVNEEEFSAHFRRIFPRLVAYARRTTDEQTAQDLASRSLESLWDKRIVSPGTPDEWAHVESLTFAILRGLMRNEARSQRRRWLLFAKVTTTTPQPILEAPEPSERILPDWFEALTRADQELLGLVADGYSVGEIAGILGCTLYAAAKRISRIRQRLRELTPREGGTNDA